MLLISFFEIGIVSRGSCKMGAGNLLMSINFLFSITGNKIFRCVFAHISFVVYCFLSTMSMVLV